MIFIELKRAYSVKELIVNMDHIVALVEDFNNDTKKTDHNVLMITGHYYDISEESHRFLKNLLPGYSKT